MISIRAKYRSGTIVVEAIEHRPRVGVKNVVGHVWAERYVREGEAFVSRAWVDQDFRGKGVAPRLYRVAAAWACAKWKMPLRSGRVRSSAAERFWEKQVRKGRAVLHHDRERGDYYELPCPVPKSLMR